MGARLPGVFGRCNYWLYMWLCGYIHRDNAPVYKGAGLGRLWCRLDSEEGVDVLLLGWDKGTEYVVVFACFDILLCIRVLKRHIPYTAGSGLYVIVVLDSW